MLNRAKLFEQISATSEIIFPDITQELQQALAIWHYLINNPDLAQSLGTIKSPLPIACWYNNLGDSFGITNYTGNYAIAGVDGSQVYPDRHEGFDCALINIGSIEFVYGHQKPVAITTIPYFITSKEIGAEAQATDSLDCLRTEFEFRHALTIAKNYKKNNSKILTLFDGSLIFWHLEHKEQGIKQRFITSYLALLQQFYEQNCSIVGYISLPKSKELINIIRAAAKIPEICDILQQKITTTFDTIVDRDIIAQTVKPGERSTIFCATAPILEFYPEFLKPCFFYYNNGFEIVRIELPAYTAEQQDVVDYICQLIADQVTKGHGYPVCLSEAHEAAVVTNQDREFFYRALHMQASSRGLQSQPSQKLQKKRYKTI